MRTRGAGIGAPLVCLFAVLALSLGVARAARAQGSTDRVLPGCGICYPGGYDPNTVGTVQGRVSDILVPEDGPVRFLVTGDDERWTVLASPAWFWKTADLRLADGETVVVRGSKSLGADGQLYVVAQSIRRAGDGPEVLMRDGRGGPLWRGSHGGGEMRGGSGPGSGSGSGSGSGPMRGRNGGGRGRR